MVHGPNFRSIESGEFEEFTTVTEYLGSVSLPPTSAKPKQKGCVLKSPYEHLDILALPLCPQHPLGNARTLVQKPKIAQKSQYVTGRNQESTNAQQ